MARTSRYPRELRERAVRMVIAHRDEYDSEWDAMRSIAGKLGIGSTETLRKWVRQAQIDQGRRQGVSTDEATRIRELERENRELRRAHEILKAAPTAVRIDRLDVHPGGAFVTRMSDDGAAFVPHIDASFLVVDEFERLVFTNAIDSQWRPANPDPVAMVAEIIFGDHPEGTDYRVVVRHGDPAARARHEELGFLDGWGSVTEQLAALLEQEPAR